MLNHLHWMRTALYYTCIHAVQVVLWGNFSYPNSRHWKKNSTTSLRRSCAIQMGLLSIYQHKQDAFRWICINSYPNVFLRRWGGCLAVPQRRWGPLGPHNTTGLNWSKIAKPVSKLIMIWNSREQSNAPDQEAPRCYRWILNKFDIKLIIFKQALVPSHYMHWGLHYYFKISLSLLVTGMEHCTHANKKGLYIGLLVIYHPELQHHYVVNDTITNIKIPIK